jgi:hypothetical protein
VANYKIFPLNNGLICPKSIGEETSVTCKTDTFVRLITGLFLEDADVVLGPTYLYLIIKGKGFLVGLFFYYPKFHVNYIPLPPPSQENAS